MKKLKSNVTKKEMEIYKKAKNYVSKSNVLMNQSSACRNAWCQGFVNGYLFYVHQKPKRKFYEFWK